MPDVLGIGSALQGAAGIAQLIGGGIQAHRATKSLEGLQSPTYSPNKSILDYYNTALQRYNTNPYNSQQYQNAIQLAGRSTAAGVNALQSRGSAVAGIGRLAALQNQQGLNAGTQAEQQQNQRFSQLGGATQMKAGEDKTAFQINQENPFERKYNLLAAKAAGGNQIMNSGLSNIFGAGESTSQMSLLNKIYGNQGSGGGGNSGRGGFAATGSDGGSNFSLTGD